MMKQIWEGMKKSIWVSIILVILGFCLGKMYANYAIQQDCKVLGMTRFGDVPMGCRVGEKSQ